MATWDKLKPVTHLASLHRPSFCSVESCVLGGGLEKVETQMNLYCYNWITLVLPSVSCRDQDESSSSAASGRSSWVDPPWSAENTQWASGRQGRSHSAGQSEWKPVWRVSVVLLRFLKGCFKSWSLSSPLWSLSVTEHRKSLFRQRILVP